MAEPAPWSVQAQRTGRFERKESEFRGWLGDPAFPPEAGRYHLYVSYACPWAHRTLLARALLGLQDALSVDVVSWRMDDDGAWRFEPQLPCCTRDSQGHQESLQGVYRRADPDFGAIGTVPVLWDKQGQTIVNNESRDVLRMLDTRLAPALRDAGQLSPGAMETLLPPGLESEVDAMIDANYESVNNGVYKCGFARSQEAFDEAYDALFTRLDALEAHLHGRDWLCGPGRGVPTEADVCLWTTLLRFDPVYHTHFKTNRNLVREMPALWAFTRRMWRLPGVRDTVHWDHIIGHYYWSHKGINPHRIVPPLPSPSIMLDA